ncbi:MAG: LRV FeS4 cluster domain-containing protein, partial [Alphaproteobacteria bacterium]|nr:LRV FeS4 cluster domain-containing protein [Alphaproteobacteria bacterium]
MDAVDWLGNFLSCRDCPHLAIREKGLCDLG